MTYRIFIVADHRWRDVPGLASVEIEIERLLPESQVLIADIHLTSQVVELFKPHVIVINHLHDKARNKIVDDVRRRGGLCIVLPTEGRPNTVTQLQWATHDFDLTLCDLYCCWSEAFQENFAAVPVESQVTGSQRFDFYDPPLNRLVRTKEQTCDLYGLDPDKSIVTVASSFPNAKFSDYGTEFMVKDWENLGIDKIRGHEDPATFAKQEKVEFLRFQSWIQAIARERDYQIVVKPHPAESTKDWMQFCESIGVKVMLTDYIFNLFAISDCHLSRFGELTALEARSEFVPIIQCFVGDKDKSLDEIEQEWVGVGDVVDNIADLLETIEECLIFGSETGINPTVTKWLGEMPKASHRIAQAIVNLVSEKSPKTYSEPSYQERVELHQFLTKHDKQNRIPRADHIGQLGKAVTLSSINEWVQRIREIS